MEKVSLPIKTKIAAWWMTLIGGGAAVFLLCFPILLSSGGLGPESALIVGLIFYLNFPPAFFFFLSGLFLLLKKKEWSWWFATITSLGLIGLIIFYYHPANFAPYSISIPSIAIPLFSLILLLLDSKNFFKIFPVEKPLLPIKTRVATRWIILVGVLVMLLGILMILDIKFLKGIEILQPFLVLALGGFICFLGFWIRKGKKRAWWASVIIFSVLLLTWLGLLFGQPVPFSIEEIISDPFFVIPFIVLLVPIILLLLDRKNFWKIAS